MRLKELRKAKKMKQTDVAEMLSCSQGVYSRYESGEREPPFDIMEKLADIYGVTVDYLMGRSTPEPEPLQRLHTNLDIGFVETKTAPADDRAEAKQLLEDFDDDQYQAALQYLKFLKSQAKKREG